MLTCSKWIALPRSSLDRSNCCGMDKALIGEGQVHIRAQFPPVEMICPITLEGGHGLRCHLAANANPCKLTKSTKERDRWEGFWTASGFSISGAISRGPIARPC